MLKVLRAPDHAAEVTQEVPVEIWQKSASFSTHRGRASWMATIAHRRAMVRGADVGWDDVAQSLGERVRKGLASLTPIQREALTLA